MSRKLVISTPKRVAYNPVSFKIRFKKSGNFKTSFFLDKIKLDYEITNKSNNDNFQKGFKHRNVLKQTFRGDFSVRISVLDCKILMDFLIIRGLKCLKMGGNRKVVKKSGDFNAKTSLIFLGRVQLVYKGL